MLGEAKEMVKEPAVLNGMLGERSNAEVAKAGGGDDCCHSEWAHTSCSIAKSSELTWTSSTFVCFSLFMHTTFFDTCRTCCSQGLVSALSAPKSWLWETVFQVLCSHFTSLRAANVAKSGLLLRSKSYRLVANKFYRCVTGHLWYLITHISSQHSACLSLPFFHCM